MGAWGSTVITRGPHLTLSCHHHSGAAVTSALSFILSPPPLCPMELICISQYFLCGCGLSPSIFWFTFCYPSCTPVYQHHEHCLLTTTLPTLSAPLLCIFLIYHFLFITSFPTALHFLNTFTIQFVDQSSLSFCQVCRCVLSSSWYVSKHLPVLQNQLSCLIHFHAVFFSPLENKEKVCTSLHTALYFHICALPYPSAHPRDCCSLSLDSLPLKVQG